MNALALVAASLAYAILGVIDLAVLVVGVLVADVGLHVRAVARGAVVGVRRAVARERDRRRARLAGQARDVGIWR